MALVQVEEAGWLKRLRKDGVERKVKIVKETSRFQEQGFIRANGLGNVTTAKTSHRSRVRSLGFQRSTLWSVGGRRINTYNIPATDSERPAVLHSIMAPKSCREFTGACTSSADRMYCLTDNAEVLVANLDVGEMEGRIPFIGRADQHNRFVKILGGPTQSSSWSLLSVLDDVGRIHVLDSRTNSVVRKLNSASQVQALAFAHSSQASILAGNSAGDIFHWDLRGETCVSRHRLQGSLGIVDMAVRAQDNTLMVSDAGAVITQHRLDSADGDAPYACIREYSNLKKVADVLTGHSRLPLLVAAHGGEPDCVKLVRLGGLTRTPPQINVRDKYVYQTWPGPRFEFGRVTSAAFDDLTTHLALGNALGYVKVWRFDDHC